MAISFVNQVSAATTAAATSLASGALPSSTAVDDILLMFATVYGNGTDPTIATPAGWVSVMSQAQSTSIRTTLFARAITGGDAAPTVTWSGVTCNAALAILAYRGVNLVTLQDSNSNGSGASGNANTGSFTTTQANDWLVYAGGMGRATTCTPPTSHTERVDVASTAGSNNCTLEVTDRAMTTAGSIGATGNTPVDATGPYATLFFAIREAGVNDVIFSSDFEGGVGTEVSSGEWESEFLDGTSSGDISATAPLVGTYSYVASIPGAASGGNAYLDRTFTLPPTNQAWIAFKLNISAQNTNNGDTVYAQLLPNSGTNPQAYLGYFTNGWYVRIKQRDGTNASVALSPAPTTGTTYDVTLGFDLSGANPVAKVYLNNVLAGTATDTATGTLNLMGRVRVGLSQFAWNGAATAKFDTVRLYATDPTPAAGTLAPPPYRPSFAHLIGR